MTYLYIKVLDRVNTRSGQSILYTVPKGSVREEKAGRLARQVNCSQVHMVHSTEMHSAKPPGKNQAK